MEAPGFYNKWPFLRLLIVLVITLPAAVSFFSRKPVILVSDMPFNVLYGMNRAILKRITLSVTHWRPIKIISFAEGAGPDLIVQGVKSLSRRPYAVFFPYRYREGAERYLHDRPGFPVVILAGREMPDSSSPRGNPAAEGLADAPEVLWIRTDSETDLYRAGAIAGAFANHIQFQEYAEGKLPDRDIGLFYNKLGEREIAAFNDGLKDQQWFVSPLYSPNLSEVNLACAVLLKEIRFQGDVKARSLIYFTWMDPSLAPRKALAIFDDSPWAQIGPALELLKEGQSFGLVPSEIYLLWGDKSQKTLNNDLKRIKTLKKMTESADN